MTQLDINEAIREVLVLMRGELGRHNVLLETGLLDGLHPSSATGCSCSRSS